MTLPFTYSFPCSSSPRNWTVSFEIDKKIWLFENCRWSYKTACFDIKTKTWEHQTVTNERHHFGIRNENKSVRTAVLNGKGYVWGQNELMEFDPVTQIWRNTGHMFRDTNKINHVSDIVQMGDCLYTYIIEFGSNKLMYYLTLNMRTGERTVREVNHFPSLERYIRLIAYNNTIYMNVVQDIFVFDDNSVKEIPTFGVKSFTKFCSCSIVGNLVYFYRSNDRKIQILNMDTFEWTSIDLEDKYKQLPFFIEEIFAVDDVFYGLWHTKDRHGIVMLEPKPSLSTICLLTLANQFTEDPTIREHLKPRWDVVPTDYQPYVELKQQIPWPLHPNFDNLIRWRKQDKISS